MFFVKAILCYLAFIVVLVVLEATIGFLLWTYVTVQYVVKLYIVRYNNNLKHEAKRWEDEEHLP